MKTGLFSILTAAALLTGCGRKDNDGFTLNIKNLKDHYYAADELQLEIRSDKNDTITRVDYYLNGKKIAMAQADAKAGIRLPALKNGYHTLKAEIYRSMGDTAFAETMIETFSRTKPKLLNYKIINTYPHNITHYTQGLEFYRDTLMEGTGRYGISKLAKVDYKTGQIYTGIDLPQNYFGEGITVLNNRIYQLTYKENTGFVYNADNFKKLKEFRYFKNMEGWGLTSDGHYLYQTDGSEKIYKLDPKSFKLLDYQNVYTNNAKIKSVNELEWIDGKIYANIYQKDIIVIIDPGTGNVEGVLNLAKLKTMVTQHPQLDVLNGIAYNPGTKTIFVTGKNWDKLFEIRIAGPEK